MFERALEHVRRLAEARVERRIARIAEQAEEDLPPGIGAQAESGGVALFGRGLRRRFATEASLRWMFFAGGSR